MKKFFTRLLLMAAMCVPWVTQAQELTICNGTATNRYVPLYGYYADAMQISQFIIPSSMLTAMNNQDIHSMMFYATSTTSWTASWKVFLTETTQTSLSDTVTTAGMTEVFAGTLAIENNELMVEFAQDYHYNGGNLLVTFRNTTTGSYSDTYFYGVNTDASTAVHRYSSTGPNTYSFLPKVLFSYGTITCYRPTSLQTTNIETYEVSLSWNDTTSASQWIVDLYDDTAHAASVISTTPYTTVYGLNANTVYMANVRAICGAGDTSSTRSCTFRTRCGHFDLPIFEDFEDYDQSSRPPCWPIREASTQTYPYIYSYANYAHSGSKTYYFYTNYGSMSFCSPKIPVSASDIEVLLWARTNQQNASNLRVQVGWTNDPNVDSVFHVVQQFNVGYDYQQYYVSFADVETEDSIYVVFRVPDNGNSNTVFIDDIMIRQRNTCMYPSDFHLADMTRTTLEVAWTDTANVGSYDIAYGPTGFDPDLVDNYVAVSDETSYVFDNLMADTIYDFYVRTNCSEGSSYWNGLIRPQLVRHPPHL